MSKIDKFKKEILTFDIYSIIDHYPGNPDYIGKDRDEEFKDSVKESNNDEVKELIANKGVLHYCVDFIGDQYLKSIYDDARFSIRSLQLVDLKEELRVLETYNYNKLIKELDLLSAKFDNEKTTKLDEHRFKAIYKEQFFYDLPAAGKITTTFVWSFKRELTKRINALERLIDDIKHSIDIREEHLKKTARQNPLSKTNLEMLLNSLNLSTQTASNNIEDIDFYKILDVALNYIDDFIEMREHFIREYEHAKIAYRNNKDSFYKALLSVVVKEVWRTLNALGVVDKNSKRCLSKPPKEVPEYRYTLTEIARFIYNINVVRFEDTLTQIKERATFRDSTTIPEKIKALFYFLEFLYVNMANFKECNPILKEKQEVLLMKKKFLEKYGYINNFDSSQYEASMKSKNEVLLINVESPIMAISHLLDVCKWSYSERIIQLSIEDVKELQKSYSGYDIAIVHEYEKKYFKYRENMADNFDAIRFLDELEVIMLPLFAFFRNKEVADKMAQQDEKIKENKTLLSSHTLEQVNGSRNKTNITKYTSKHYALAFIFDCLATGVDFTLYDSKKMDLEAIGEKRVNGALSGNTFYKAFNSIMSEKINLKNERDLIYLAGDNWRKIIIELSHESEKVTKYIKEEVFYEKGGNRAYAP